MSSTHPRGCRANQSAFQNAMSRWRKCRSRPATLGKPSPERRAPVEADGLLHPVLGPSRVRGAALHLTLAPVVREERVHVAVAANPLRAVHLAGVALLHAAERGL